MRPGEAGRGRVWIAVGVLVVLAIGIAVTGFYARNELEPPSSTHGPVVAITIHTGETLDGVSSDLASNGIVRSAFWFALYARVRGLSSHLQPGTYHFDDGMGASAVVAKLEGPPDAPPGPRVTFAEGETAQQMADQLSKTSGISITSAAYMHEVTQGHFTEPFLTGLPAGAPLEGFLFPDTYDIPANATAHDVVQMQLDDFQRKAAASLTSPSLTPYQVVIVGSVIEREAKYPADRPIVSSVIANRLAAGMNLQVDATVLYGLGVTGRNPTAQELAQDTPYNTYIHPGLPPTPISNPGVSSLTAAAHPSQTQYLYYISDCSGHNHYSMTEAEQEQAISEYLSQPCQGG